MECHGHAGALTAIQEYNPVFPVTKYQVKDHSPLANNSRQARSFLGLGRALALVGAIVWVLLKGLFHLGVAQTHVTTVAAVVMVCVGLVLVVVRWWDGKE